MGRGFRVFLLDCQRSKPSRAPAEGRTAVRPSGHGIRRDRACRRTINAPLPLEPCHQASNASRAPAEGRMVLSGAPSRREARSRRAPLRSRRTQGLVFPTHNQCTSGTADAVSDALHELTSLSVVPVPGPSERVLDDVPAHSLKMLLAPNRAVEISSLPNRTARCSAQGVDPSRGRCLEPCHQGSTASRAPAEGRTAVRPSGPGGRRDRICIRQEHSAVKVIRH